MQDIILSYSEWKPQAVSSKCLVPMKQTNIQVCVYLNEHVYPVTLNP